MWKLRTVHGSGALHAVLARISDSACSSSLSSSQPLFLDAENIHGRVLSSLSGYLVTQVLKKVRKLNPEKSRYWGTSEGVSKIITVSKIIALVVKNPPANAGDIRDPGSIPGMERSPGEEHGNPLQYSCLENPMDRGVWTTVHVVAKSWTRLSN